MRSLFASALPLACLALASCSGESGSPPAAKPSAVEVTVAPVTLRAFADTTVAIGNLRSFESVDISATVTERVESLHFEDGQRVQKGQLLAQLDDAEEQAVVEMARAELAEEEREITRLEGLADQRAIAEVTLEERRTAGVVAENEIARAESLVQERKIVAPFDGVVGLRRISPGALVTPGAVITTLDQIDRMKLDFTVPEVFLGELEGGETLEASSAAFPGEIFEAKIQTIDSRVDTVTRSIVVRSLLENSDGRLRPGMLMTVELQRNARQTPAIPERSLIPDGETQSVYRITADGTAEKVSVKIGARVPGYVEIVTGIAAGDRVVTDGVLSLSPGAAVAVAGEFSEPAPAFDPTR